MIEASLAVASAGLPFGRLLPDLPDQGFAFVVMGSQADAVKATQMFNGYSLDDREIRVGTAHERDASRGGGFNDRNGGNNGSRRPITHKNRGGSKRY